jgi:hypothetical protein
LLTFADVAAWLSRATRREVTFHPVPRDAFVSGVAESGASEEVVWMLD